MDIELTTGSVYAAYEEAVLEYSYIVTCTSQKHPIRCIGHDDRHLRSRWRVKDRRFDVALKYPRTTFAHIQRLTEGYGGQAGIGANSIIYSASFESCRRTAKNMIYIPFFHRRQIPTPIQQQRSSSLYWTNKRQQDSLSRRCTTSRHTPCGASLDITADSSPSEIFRNYGQYADDSTFQLIPVWQNKAQAMAFEDSIYTRNSHYSFELHHDKLKIFPAPTSPGSISPLHK